MYFSRSETNGGEYKYSKTASMLAKLVHVVRVFGVFTAIVMFGVGVDIAIHHHSFGFYVMYSILCLFVIRHLKHIKGSYGNHTRYPPRYLKNYKIYYVEFYTEQFIETLMSLLVFFLEITWAITLFLNVCIKNEFNPIFSCWEVVLWLRLWKKSLLYTIFSMIFFLWPHGLWLSNVAGALLLWLSILYIVITFKDSVQKRSDFAIVSKGQASTSYDQYDDITDLLGDTIHVSLSADNLSELDQDGILEL